MSSVGSTLPRCLGTPINLSRYSEVKHLHFHLQRVKLTRSQHNNNKKKGHNSSLWNYTSMGLAPRNKTPCWLDSHLDSIVIGLLFAWIGLGQFCPHFEVSLNEYQKAPYWPVEPHHPDAWVEDSGQLGTLWSAFIPHCRWLTSWYLHISVGSCWGKTTFYMFKIDLTQLFKTCRWFVCSQYIQHNRNRQSRSHTSQLWNSRVQPKSSFILRHFLQI